MDPRYSSEYNIPEEFRPISMWGYFGYSLLFAIPLVGLILIIVFSFGATRNVNLRNYARSFFCWLIIAGILVVIMFVLGGSAAFFEHFRSMFSAGRA